MNKSKQLIVNMSASFIAYIVSFGISFFLSPYIVQNIGVEANGFVGLASNFISYANLITIALNSLAGRFITIKIHEKDIEGANKYYTSVFISNVVLTAFMAIIAFFTVAYLDKLINIPKDILNDVKLLFALQFANCLISVVTSVFSVATFATNKLYISSIRKIEGNLIRLVCVIGLFTLFEPRVSYLGITTLITGVYSALFTIYYKFKLLPEIKIRKKYFDFKAVIELLSSGVWNLITRVGQLLLDGIDLLISNLFINATAMGVLALSKTIPNIITGIVGTMAGIFSPNFTILYAQNKMDELVSSVKQSMKIMGVVCNLPIIILITCGQPFFALWQPTQDASKLQILSILTCAGLIFNGGINSIYNIFTVVNKLKFNSILVCVCGVLSSALVFLLLNTTDLGLYAVAGVSTSIMIVKNVFLIVPYAARCLNQRWYIFYPYVFRPVFFVLISCVLGYAVRTILPSGNWIQLIVLGIVIGLISMIIGLFVILDRNDRKYLRTKIIKRN